MKKLSLYVVLAALGIASFSALAATPVKDDKAERLELSKELHDIRNIRERINATVSAVAETIPPADREDFERYIQLKMDYDALEDKSVRYAADIYAANELKAMIAYFGSPDGQSAEAKGAAFADKIAKDIGKEIDAAVIAAKYDGVPESALPPTGHKGLSVGNLPSSKMPMPNVSPDLLDSPKK